MRNNKDNNMRSKRETKKQRELQQLAHTVHVDGIDSELSYLRKLLLPKMRGFF